MSLKKGQEIKKIRTIRLEQEIIKPMLNEERKRYQAYAMACMKNKTRVKHGNGTYTVGAMIYSLRDKTDEEMFTVLLHDVGMVESSITVGLEEFFNENTRSSDFGTQESRGDH